MPQSRIASPHLPQRTSLGRLINQSTILLLCAISGLILVLAIFILFHQNANATKGYQLRTLERERSLLLLDDEILKMQIAESQALTVLEDDRHIATMMKPRFSLYTKPEESVADSTP